MSDKKASEEETAEQPVLRRSSRATRGSIKPVIDLTKDDQDDPQEDDDVEEVEVKVNQRKPSRRSSTKQAPPKKTPAKRGTNKKPILKQESDDKEVSDEEDKIEIDSEDKTDRSAGKIKKETASKDGGSEAEDVDEDDELFYDLNEKEMKEINNAFDINRISDEEELLNADGIRTAMRLLGFEPRGDEIKKLVKKFAAKKSGKVTRDGFHKIMAYKYSTTPTMRNDRSNDEISRVFNLLDLDKTGKITLENLRSISRELNEELTDDDLREMIQEADLDGDHKINKDEFHNIMKKTSLY